jgi:hypothetical protein
MEAWLCPSPVADDIPVTRAHCGATASMAGLSKGGGQGDGGLSTEEIARAVLVPLPTIAIFSEKGGRRWIDSRVRCKGTHVGWMRKKPS